jgi:hypothetical protein
VIAADAAAAAAAETEDAVGEAYSSVLERATRGGETDAFVDTFLDAAADDAEEGYIDAVIAAAAIAVADARIRSSTSRLNESPVMDEEEEGSMEED